MEPVTVRYWAALRQAAGTDAEHVPPGLLSEVLAALRSRHGSRYAEVLAVCSLLLDGVQVGTHDPATVDLPAGAELDCLPPVAGG